MTGDFTRDSFDPFKHFTRVLMQQGRPQLDADWNEQVSIFWQYWRQFAIDLIGPFAGPDRNCGFGVITQCDFPLPSESQVSAEEQERLQGMLKDAGEFLITPGHYYVHGILCENRAYIPYSHQIHPSEALLQPKNKIFHLIYLDVSEVPVTGLEDSSILEPALNNVDTCIRTKIVWRVRTQEVAVGTVEPDKVPDCAHVKDQWPSILDAWQAENRGRIRAKAKSTSEEGAGLDPSVVSPDASYRGLQNQLYRVQIHRGGCIEGGPAPTFKVSRENGAVAFSIASIEDSEIRLTSRARDSRFGLQVGDWVEVVDPEHDDTAHPEPLLRVKSFEPMKVLVTVEGKAQTKSGHHRGKRLILLRWDQKAGDPRRGGLELEGGAAILKEGEGDTNWLTLEQGVQVQFHRGHPAHRYRRGDYWLIPARVAIGDVIWPREEGKPLSLPPAGVTHYYAPLAIAAFNSKGILETQGDCRPKFKVPIAF